MNIFVTDFDPIICAQHHNSVHLNKMIIEQMQLLSTAHIVLDGTQVAYKKTHENHPCAKWIRKEKSNYMWGYKLAKALCDEYTFRTGKVHKSSEKLSALSTAPKNISEKYGTMTHIPKAMPDEFKEKDVVQSYKNYLNAKFIEWRTRDKPIKVDWGVRGCPEWVC